MKAYPAKESKWNEIAQDFITINHTGMELRDYFASKVLPSVIQHWPNADFIGAAEIAYQYADAMMDARQ